MSHMTDRLYSSLEDLRLIHEIALLMENVDTNEWRANGGKIESIANFMSESIYNFLQQFEEMDSKEYHEHQWLRKQAALEHSPEAAAKHEALLKAEEEAIPPEERSAEKEKERVHELIKDACSIVDSRMHHDMRRLVLVPVRKPAKMAGLKPGHYRLWA